MARECVPARACVCVCVERGVHVVRACVRVEGYVHVGVFDLFF